MTAHSNRPRLPFAKAAAALDNRILPGDCVEVLQGVPSRSVDFVLTDPPYITNYVSRDGRSIPNDDNDAWLKPAFAQIFRVLKEDSFCVSFYGWHQADRFIAAWREAGFRISGHIVFAKRYSSSQRFLKYQHESAYLLTKGKPQLSGAALPDVLPWSYTHNRFHPTQKPVDALKTLIKSFSAPGETVLDPFCGSGSTLIAAYALNRKYLGIELDPGYFEIAAQRLARASAAQAA